MENIEITKIDHIGIAVKNIESSMPLYKNILQLDFHGEEEVTERKVRTAIFSAGESKLELLQSLTPDGPIARHIEKKGEGVAHIALQVKDIYASIAHLKEKGITLLSDTPQTGADNKLIVFAHPKSTGGILYEFCQSIQESNNKGKIT